MFDKDGGGSINATEVKDVLCSGQNLDDDVWDKVINEVDNDGNGEIDFEEFCDMMQKMLHYDDDDEENIEDQFMLGNGNNITERKNKSSNPVSPQRSKADLD